MNEDCPFDHEVNYDGNIAQLFIYGRGTDTYCLYCGEKLYGFPCEDCLEVTCTLHPNPDYMTGKCDKCYRKTKAYHNEVKHKVKELYREHDHNTFNAVIKELQSEGYLK